MILQLTRLNRLLHCGTVALWDCIVYDSRWHEAVIAQQGLAEAVWIHSRIQG